MSILSTNWLKTSHVSFSQKITYEDDQANLLEMNFNHNGLDYVISVFDSDTLPVC